MAVVEFISHVEQDINGGWYIKLTDTFSNEEVICDSLDIYKEKIEDMGGEYGNDIAVVWTRSNKLTPNNIDDLQKKMAILQEEYSDEINKINNDNGKN